MPIFSGLGQRRGSKPRDLHIRKISFSGCSLSSDSDRSFSSDSSTSTIRAHTPRLASSSGTAASFDAFSIHSAFQPPKRLHDRPFILTDRQHYEPAATFYDSEDAEGSDLEGSERDFDGEDEDLPQFIMELPHASPVSHHDYDAADEPQDYFFMHVRNRKRPSLPQSRWSDSTIASTVSSLDDLTPVTSMSEPASSSAMADAEEAGAAGESTPGRLAAITTVPKRPTFKAVDSFEEYVRRGGWKRRGIVFNREDMDTYESR
ncbi:hypothetical protein Trco_007015 [Trichoderma cornu-damae]|uniref:Uncharacterized protein n=1 Tax=Trichoderma cornu-damae TaxID=654480 RepID=A0A9P8QME3_9HYPO|nr:hypothetical protein Trco_007015 [Trichoderma cornu-damae]